MSSTCQLRWDVAFKGLYGSPSNSAIIGLLDLLCTLSVYGMFQDGLRTRFSGLVLGWSAGPELAKLTW